MANWKDEWRVDSAYPRRSMRDKEYIRKVKMYGAKKVKKVDRKKYIVFGDNLPFLIKVRRSANRYI